MAEEKEVRLKVGELTIRTHFFTEDELNQITNKNKSFR
jgi:hypothetical protein